MPLFVEELTKAVLEAAARKRGWRRLSASPLPAPGGAGDLARLADGAAGPAGPGGQGGCADRRGDRPRVRLRAVEPVARAGRSRELREALGSARRCRAWCSAAARRRNPRISSSTRWCRMRPTAHCCAAGARSCTPASPRRWNSDFADLVERAAGTAGASPSGGWRQRTRRRAMAEGGSAYRRAPGTCRGDRPSRTWPRAAGHAAGNPGAR